MYSYVLYTCVHTHTHTVRITWENIKREEEKGTDTWSKERKRRGLREYDEKNAENLSKGPELYIYTVIASCCNRSVPRTHTLKNKPREKKRFFKTKYGPLD
jgi:hypothetical protein